MLGRAASPERRAFRRLEAPGEHFTRTTFGRLAHDDATEPELPLGVERGEFLAQSERAPPDLADATPLAIDELEHLLHTFPRGNRTLSANGPHVLVLDDVTAGF